MRFWSFLKRKIASKDKIIKQKILLYLIEYVWKHNRCNDSEIVKMQRTLHLLENNWGLAWKFTQNFFEIIFSRGLVNTFKSLNENHNLAVYSHMIPFFLTGATDQKTTIRVRL
jgi:hypothetical protein